MNEYMSDSDSQDCFVLRTPAILMYIRKSLCSFHSHSFYPHIHKVALCPIENASELVFSTVAAQHYLV